MTGWADQLDRFEASLGQQRRAVAEGRPEDVQAFSPDVVAPLPAELADRARALSARADALTVELAAATASAARQLQLVTVMHGLEQPTPSYIDQRG